MTLSKPSADDSSAVQATETGRTESAGRYRDVTRERVLEAAERLFLEKGFRATSVQEIAAAAGYTTGAIYSSFSGKDELFLTIYRRRTDWEREVWEEAVESVASTGDLAEAMGQGLAVVMPEPAWYAAVFEFLSYAARDEELSRETAEIFSVTTPHFIGLLRDRASSSPLPVDRLALVILALMRGLGMTWFADPDSADPRLFPDAISVLMGRAPSEALPTSVAETTAQ